MVGEGPLVPTERKEPSMTTCDFCEVEFDELKRHVVTMTRPSDPYELCAVMWACPACGDERDLPTVADVHEAIELSGGYYNDQPIYWVSV